jgi:glucan endo-1,3-alpha-glucosidase
MFSSRHGLLGGRNLAVLVGLFLIVQQTFAAPAPHYVFAHYMVCFATYGATVQGYEREMQEAQAAGIDGFALDEGAWSGADTSYKTRTQLIYAAAAALGTNFKLFFSVDLGDTNDIVDMVKTYGTNANSFHYQGKVVLSTYGQNALDWSGSVFAPLRAAGIKVFFVPMFWPNPVQELPSYQDGVNILNTYSNILDGLFFFGAAGLPYQLAQCNSNYNTAVHQAGKIFMASYTPTYWGCAQYSINRRYFETDGGEGTIPQWQSILTNQPDWVEITTWNDFNESTYVSPVDNPGQYESQLLSPYRYSHTGYLELSKPFIAAYKSGAQPALNQDALFYYYRTHSWYLTALNTNDPPVRWCLGDLSDDLYTTVLLTAPASLVIASGGQTTTNSLATGINYVRTPFSAGTQQFTLWRGGAQLLSVQGPGILSQIQVYDCFPASGYAYANGPSSIWSPPPSTGAALAPPTNLHLVHP